MPATPADIGAAIRDAAIAAWSDPAVQSRYPSARDAQGSPSTGYFDTLADAQAAAAARGVLIGSERRRFSVVVQDVLWIDPRLGVPVMTLADAEQGPATLVIICRAEVDLEASTTTLEVFG